MSQAKPAQQLIDAHDSPFFAQSGLLTMSSTANKFQFWTIYFMLNIVYSKLSLEYTKKNIDSLHGSAVQMPGLGSRGKDKQISPGLQSDFPQQCLGFMGSSGSKLKNIS